MSCLPCCGKTVDPPVPPSGCFTDIDTIMSQNGLITDCHSGIKPEIGEILAVQMQANGFAGIRDAARPIVLGYALSRYSDVVQTSANFPQIYKSESYGGSSVQDSACNFIWWTKNRCLGKQDQYFPQANACGCMGTDPRHVSCSSYVQNDGWYGGNCSFPEGGGGSIGWEWPLNYTVDENPSQPQNLICGGENECQDYMFGCENGGKCDDATNVCCRFHYKPANTQREYGENEVGTYISELWNYTQVRRRWSYNPEYPPATYDEAKSSMYVGESCPHNGTDLTSDSVEKGCGLTPYQERVSEHLNPDIWEILQFNDKKPIVILNRELELSDPELMDTGLQITGNIAGSPISINASSGAKDIAAGPDFLVALAKYQGIECTGQGAAQQCFQLAGYGSDVLISYPPEWMSGKGITKFRGLFAAHPSSDTPPYYNHLQQSEINPVVYTPEWSPPFKLSAGGERCIITRKNGATETAGNNIPIATQETPYVKGTRVETILFDPAIDHKGSSTVPYSPASTGISYNWICQNGCQSCRYPWFGPFSETNFPMQCGIAGGEFDVCPYYQTQYISCNGTAVNVDTGIPLGGFQICPLPIGGTGTFVESETSVWVGEVQNKYSLNLCDGVQSWKQISCGLHHNVAINQYGTTGGSNVFCWGASYANQCNFNSATVGLAKKITAGYYHNIAIRNDDTIWSWGGGGTYNKEQSSITQFNGIKFIDIAGGKFHSCGIKSNGKVVCWGAGLSGQSGENNFNQSAPPIELTDSGSSNIQAKSIACGAYHSCAILLDGGLTCWGHSGDNRLAFNTTNKKYTKVVCGEKFSAAKWKPTGFYRSYPIVLPHTNEIIPVGNWPHNLFKYFFTFVSQQFSYVLGQVDCLEDGSQPPNLLMNRSMPQFFHQIGDAVHLFSFEFDGDQDLQDGLQAICEQSNWDQGYELGYNKQQLMPQDLKESVFQAHSDEQWEQNVDRANYILGSKLRDRLQLKDWRKEIYEDIVTLFTGSQGWSQINQLMAKYDNPSKIKCVGPARLSGDKWEIRAAQSNSSLPGNNKFNPFGADLNNRAPSLARMASPKDGSSWPDCYKDGDTYTLQVNEDIYQLAEPPEGIASLSLEKQKAFYRLTNSVYFRSRAMLPNWEWSPRNFATRGPWPDESDLKHWSRRNHRTAWLQKIGRQLSPPPNQTSVDRYSVMQSIGTALGGLPSSGPQPYWSISGQGQASYPTIEKGIGETSLCDNIWGSRMAHLGNSCSFIGRYVPAIPGSEYRSKNSAQKHTADGSYVPDEIFFDAPTDTQYTPVRHIAHEESVNESSLTSNICFGRFIGRNWMWDNSQVPFQFKSVNPAQHPVDSNNVCSEIPAPKMHPGMASRPWNSRTWIDQNDSIKLGGPYFQQNQGSLTPPGWCNGLRPARGIMEWDGPAHPCGGGGDTGAPRGPEVRTGWMNNFVFDPETGRMDGGSGCTYIFNEECCEQLTSQCDPIRCPNQSPCECNNCTERWLCLQQIKCETWDGPTYGLYEPAVGASFSGGKTGNSCCFIPSYEGGSSFDKGNPLFEEWRNNAFISLPPIRPTPKSPDGCQNREKASCCFWQEYQPGEFVTSGKHFKTYFLSEIPKVEDSSLGAWRYNDAISICNTKWFEDNEGNNQWAKSFKITKETLPLLSPDLQYPGLARGRMMCLENEIDPEWQHNSPNSPRACVPKGITLGSAGAFSYADNRFQAKECNSELVIKLNRLLAGYTSGIAGFEFTRCYNQSEISGCTDTDWCLPSSSSTENCAVTLPPGWVQQSCGETGCCVCFGRQTGVANNTHFEDWLDYGSFEQYCKGALNGNYRIGSKCPRGECKTTIENSNFNPDINAYKFNCNPLRQVQQTLGPGTESPPLECPDCEKITSRLSFCDSEFTEDNKNSLFEFAKFNPIGYGIWDPDGLTWEKAGVNGCCRSPLHPWVSVFGWDERGDIIEKSSDSGGLWSATSLDMTYVGPCWPNPKLFDQINNIQNGKIELNASVTWQPCQHGTFVYDESENQWKHESVGIQDSVCQTGTGTLLDCCSDLSKQDVKTFIETTEGGQTLDGYWTKQIRTLQPFAQFFFDNGLCNNVNATPSNCWVCPTYKKLESSGLSCLTGSGQGSGCNCVISSQRGELIQYQESQLDGEILELCKCSRPIECPSDPECTQKVCNYQSSCCELGWDEDCSDIAVNLCKCSQPRCPCECRNYDALIWSADEYNPEGWTGGKTVGLDLLSRPQDCPPGITCEDCRKCDLPLCIHKYNCNLKCPCGTYGMNCEKTCTDSTGFYGEYDKDFLGRGDLVWRNANNPDGGGGDFGGGI